MDYSRIKFAKKSLHKARRFQDPFIKFIVLWIGLNAFYHNDNIKRENEKIKTYFKSNKNLIFKLLSQNKQNLELISQFMNDTPQHRKLNEFLKTRRAFLILNDKDNSIKDFAEFISQVRNNMFHAAKVWDEEDEAKLLSMINPILEKFLEELVRIRNYYIKQSADY